MDNKEEQVEVVSDELEEVLGKALFFELDNVAVKGRELVYDIVSGILEEKGVDFSRGLFCQYCLYQPIKVFVPEILAKLGRTRLSEDKLVAEIEEAVKLTFVDGNIKLNAGIIDVIDGAIKDGASVGAISTFDEATADRLMEKLGLTEKGAEVLSNGSAHKHVPSSDAWLRLAKKMDVPATCCVAIASSARACKSALSAGMKCVVLTDKFTSFQDFGGADFVLDTIDKDAVASILGLFDL